VIWWTIRVQHDSDKVGDDAGQGGRGRHASALGQDLLVSTDAVGPHSHCSFCGSRFDPAARWPRSCSACHNVSYRNPLPVVVTVVPVEGGGVLLVRRRQEPVGLGLPSGFVEFGERWQDTAAREVAEETGIRLDPDGVRELRVRSGADGTLLVFASAPPRSPAALRAFKPSPEVSEVVVASAPHPEVVFRLDNELLADWFSDTVPPASASPG
jgi:8-oxo-dGTP pyrophosphatase MutT (NUDIX family)